MSRRTEELAREAMEHVVPWGRHHREPEAAFRAKIRELNREMRKTAVHPKYKVGHYVLVRGGYEGRIEHLDWHHPNYGYTIRLLASPYASHPVGSLLFVHASSIIGHRVKPPHREAPETWKDPVRHGAPRRGRRAEYLVYVDGRRLETGPYPGTARGPAWFSSRASALAKARELKAKGHKVEVQRRIATGFGFEGKRVTLRKGYDPARRAQQPAPRPTLIGTEHTTPAGFRWFRRMVSEASYGQTVWVREEGSSVEHPRWFLLRDKPERLPRFFETLAASQGRIVDRLEGRAAVVEMERLMKRGAHDPRKRGRR